MMDRFGLINCGVLPLLLEAMSPLNAQEARYLTQDQTLMSEKLPPQTKLSIEIQQLQAKAEQERQRKILQLQQRKVEEDQHGYKDEHLAVWKFHRASDWHSEHRNWQDRGGYSGYRISEDRYRGYFGPGHAIRICNYPLVVLGGHPLFQCCGFWFGVMDPLPENWSAKWYEKDDVYIDYSGGGYYLKNRKHPQDSIAVSVYAD